MLQATLYKSDYCPFPLLPITFYPSSSIFQMRDRVHTCGRGKFHLFTLNLIEFQVTYHEECHEDIHHTCEQLTVTPVPYKPAYVSPTPKPHPYTITPVPYKPGPTSPSPPPGPKYDVAHPNPSPKPYPPPAHQQYKSPAPKHFPSLTAHLPKSPPHHPHNPTGPTALPSHHHQQTTGTPHTFTTPLPPHLLHSPTPHSLHLPHLLPHHHQNQQHQKHQQQHHLSHFQSTTPFPSAFSPSTTVTPSRRGFPSPTLMPSPRPAESSTMHDSFFPSMPRRATAVPPSSQSTTVTSSQFRPFGPRLPKQQDLNNLQLDEKRAVIVNQFNSLLSRQRRESRASSESDSSAQFQPFLPLNPSRLNEAHFLNHIPFPASFSPTSAVPTVSPQLRLSSSGNSLFEVIKIAKI